jgi:hypothetical protein
MRLTLALALVSLASLTSLTGCSSSNGDGSKDAGSDASFDDAGEDSGAGCIDETPDACPSPEPSYTSDVLPVLQAHCYECHADAGLTTSESQVDLGSYAAVYSERGTILGQVSTCRMPPSVAPLGLTLPPAPTDADRATILGWLKCNAPDN